MDFTIYADMLAAISVGVAEALEESTLGRPELTITPHSTPVDDCCNFVGVWMVAGRPTNSREWPGGGQQPVECGDYRMVPEIEIAVRRPCQPILGESRSAPLPAPSKITAAGQDLLVDYAILACSAPGIVQQVVNSRQGYQQLVQRILVGSLTPHSVGDCAGWNFRFRLEVD